MNPQQRQALAELVKAGDIEQAREMSAAMGSERLDLSGADLSNADLECMNLSGADLSGADLSGADLDSADLTGANLTDVVGLKVTP